MPLLGIEMFGREPQDRPVLGFEVVIAGFIVVNLIRLIVVGVAVAFDVDVSVFADKKRWE